MWKQTARCVIWLTVLAALGTNAATVGAQDLPAAFCALAIHDETTELENARIAVDLAKSGFAAYERIFKMIEKLYGAETIPRMEYLRAKYERDAAKLELDAADLVLERQSALVGQYRLICNGTAPGSNPEERASEIRKAYLRYRRADCGSMAKTVEAAATKLEFNREFLKRTVDLRRENFATHTQIILAELDVERQEKSLADATRRTETCRSELAGLEGGARAPSSKSSQ